jgi:hypothetical protein
MADDFAPPSNNKFVSIPNLLSAGLGETDEPRTFYRREAFDTLAKFVDSTIAGNHIGLVDGLPGTGKSSTIWWALQQPKYHDKEVAWLHMDRSGYTTTFAKKPRRGEFTEHLPIVQTAEIKTIDADILVIDGVNHTNFGVVADSLRRWVLISLGKTHQPRSGFLTMSNKIKREHLHELRMLEASQKKGTGVAQYYCTHHSWTLNEFLLAFLLPGGKRSQLFNDNLAVFESEWDIEEDDQGDTSGGPKTRIKKRDRNGCKKISSVREVITQKFAHAGGSARWMLQLLTTEIDAEIGSCLDECSNMADLLSFSLGSTSPVAKTHLYYSSVGERGQTVYSMVSERATLLAVDRHGANGIKELYKHAATLKNPAFLGWVIEADLFNRCKTGRVKLRKKGEEEDIDIEAQRGAAVEFDHGHLLALFEDVDHTKVSEEMNKLVPGKDETRTCKPTSWNQGGYDVVFIEVNREDANRLVVRFGQVTKSDSHSLKLKYFDNFLEFLKAAGYVVDSVELAFIVPLSKIDTFRITGSQVESSGLLNGHTRYGTGPTRDSSQMQKNRWTKTKEHDQIHIYGLDMTSMGYPEGI